MASQFLLNFGNFGALRKYFRQHLTGPSLLVVTVKLLPSRQDVLFCRLLVSRRRVDDSFFVFGRFVGVCLKRSC